MQTEWRSMIVVKTRFAAREGKTYHVGKKSNRLLRFFFDVSELTTDPIFIQPLSKPGLKSSQRLDELSAGRRSHLNDNQRPKSPGFSDLSLAEEHLQNVVLVS